MKKNNRKNIINKATKKSFKKYNKVYKNLAKKEEITFFILKRDFANWDKNKVKTSIFDFNKSCLYVYGYNSVALRIEGNSKVNIKFTIANLTLYTLSHISRYKIFQKIYIIFKVIIAKNFIFINKDKPYGN